MKSHKIIRIVIVLAAVLLIAALALPAFADTENGNGDPVISEDIVLDETSSDSDVIADVTEPAVLPSEGSGESTAEMITASELEDGADENTSDKEENSGETGSPSRKEGHKKFPGHRSNDSDSRADKHPVTDWEREICHRRGKKGTAAEPNGEDETENQKDLSAGTDTAADADKTGEKHSRSFTGCRYGHRYPGKNGTRSNSGGHNPMKGPYTGKTPSDEDNE